MYDIPVTPRVCVQHPVCVELFIAKNIIHPREFLSEQLF